MPPEEENKKEELSKSLHNKNLLPSLRTYQGDVASFIQNKDQSVADLAMKQRAGHQKRVEEGREVDTLNAPKKAQSTNFLISALAGFLLIASAGIIIYFIYARLISTPVNVVTSNSILGDDPSISSKVANTTTFISNNKWEVPPALLRSLSPELITGSYKQGDFFVILKTDDYGIAFRDMLAWEQNMFVDLKPLLNTSASSTDYADYKFKDLIVKNKDTRSFSSSYGKTALIYTFINQNTILITQSEDALTALVNALLAGNTVR